MCALFRVLKIFATKRNCFPRLGPFLKTTSALCIHRLGRDQVPQSPFVSVFRPIFHIEISFSLSLQQIYHKYSSLFLLFRIKSPPEITQGRKTKKKISQTLLLLPYLLSHLKKEKKKSRCNALLTSTLLRSIQSLCRCWYDLDTGISFFSFFPEDTSLLHRPCPSNRDSCRESISSISTTS